MGLEDHPASGRQLARMLRRAEVLDAVPSPSPVLVRDQARTQPPRHLAITASWEVRRRCAQESRALINQQQCLRRPLAYTAEPFVPHGAAPPSTGRNARVACLSISSIGIDRQQVPHSALTLADVGALAEVHIKNAAAPDPPSPNRVLHPPKQTAWRDRAFLRQCAIARDSNGSPASLGSSASTR